MYLIALLKKKLREQRAILTGDARDECNLPFQYASPFSSERPKSPRARQQSTSQVRKSQAQNTAGVACLTVIAVNITKLSSIPWAAALVGRRSATALDRGSDW